jgi:hypothetical protein
LPAGWLFGLPPTSRLRILSFCSGVTACLDNTAASLLMQSEHAEHVV